MNMQSRYKAKDHQVAVELYTMHLSITVAIGSALHVRVPACLNPSSKGMKSHKHACVCPLQCLSLSDREIWLSIKMGPMVTQDFTVAKLQCIST